MARERRDGVLEELVARCFAVFEVLVCVSQPRFGLEIASVLGVALRIVALDLALIREGAAVVERRLPHLLWLMQVPYRVVLSLDSGLGLYLIVHIWLLTYEHLVLLIGVICIIATSTVLRSLVGVLSRLVSLQHSRLDLAYDPGRPLAAKLLRVLFIFGVLVYLLLCGLLLVLADVGLVRIFIPQLSIVVAYVLAPIVACFHLLLWHQRAPWVRHLSELFDIHARIRINCQVLDCVRGKHRQEAVRVLHLPHLVGAIALHVCLHLQLLLKLVHVVLFNNFQNAFVHLLVFLFLVVEADVILNVE